MGKRKNPRISLNKISEYLEANSSRRKRIIQDQKNPKVFISSRYTKARIALTKYLLNGKADKGIIEQSITRLLLEEHASNFKQQDKILSIEALTIFDFNPLDEDLFQFDLKKNHHEKSIDIEGVKVSVNPDIVIKGKFKGEPFMGAIKFHFSKNTPLGKEAGSTVSTLLKLYLEENYNFKVNSKYCLSIDVFQNMIYTAPNAYKRRLQQIKDACNEIRIVWKNID